MKSQSDDQFINTFVTTFIATWCANHYDEACAKEKHQTLYHPPIEDAKDIAISILGIHQDKLNFK